LLKNISISYIVLIIIDLIKLLKQETKRETIKL